MRVFELRCWEKEERTSHRLGSSVQAKEWWGLGIGKIALKNRAVLESGYESKGEQCLMA